MIAMDFGMFEEGVVFDFVLKTGHGKKVVITAIDFAFARIAGGAGDGIVGEALGGETTAESGFSGARGAGDEIENT